MPNNRYFTPSGSFDLFLNRLLNLRSTGQNCWTACCPAHDDRNPSLSIRLVGERILLKCFRGCESEAVLNALGFDSWADLYSQTECPYSPQESYTPVQTPDEGQRAKLERLWQSAKPIGSQS